MSDLIETQEDLKGYWFIFYENKILVNSLDNNIGIPFIHISSSNLAIIRKLYLGKFNHSPCYCAELESEQDIPKNMDLLGLRQLMGSVKEDIFWMAGKAFQIMDWNRTFQFCGQCGSPTETLETEYAKKCPQCHFINYPRISPAIIVAIVKDNKLLLARNSRFPSGFYSVLAGFVEPGENLEECVIREVKEEVGIDLKNISYFGSQPWPFPNSLMLGFTAEYAGGEIKVDQKEILAAQWFTAENIPKRPTSLSIASRLIDWFINNYK